MRDGAANDNVCRSCPKRKFRRGNARLLVGAGPRELDTWRDDQRVARQQRFEITGLQGRSHDAMAAASRSELRQARTLKLALVPLTDAWAQRETKIVNRAGQPLPRLAAKLVRHLANFSFADRLL